MVLADAIGWAGAACLLLAYARLSSGRLALGVRYHLLNLAGAGGLAVNGAFHHAWPSTALNLIWLGIGLTALRGRTKVHQDESRTQGLDRLELIRFLRVAQTITVHHGALAYLLGINALRGSEAAAVRGTDSVTTAGRLRCDSRLRRRQHRGRPSSLPR
jgi:hypothetical protein